MRRFRRYGTDSNLKMLIDFKCITGFANTAYSNMHNGSWLMWRIHNIWPDTNFFSSDPDQNIVALFNIKKISWPSLTEHKIRLFI